MEKLRIEGLRGVREGELDGLTRLNVLVGANNSGKSTVLEAMALAANPEECWPIVAGHRGAPAVEYRIAAQFHDGAPIVLQTEAGEVARFDRAPESPDDVGLTRPGKSRRVGGYANYGQRYFEKPGVQLHLGDTGWGQQDFETAWSLAERAGRRRRVVDLLKPLMPRLDDFRLSYGPVLEHAPTLHVEEVDRPQWPMRVAGDGFKRLFLLACRLSTAPGKLVLIEEPELFQHPRAMQQLAELLWAAAEPRRNTQIVLTTHSLEFIDALLASANARLDELSVFRLRLADGRLTALRVGGVEARERRDDVGEDLRR